MQINERGFPLRGLVTRLLPSFGGTLSAAELVRIGRSYLQVLAGTGGRLVLQAVYFLTLANALTLAEMGIFASASAVGIIIGAFSGFGFSAIAFQAAAGRQRLVGAYFGIFLAASAVTLPIGLAISAPFYLVIFKDSLPLHTFLMIMVVEIFMFKLVEGLHKVNNGLGRYARASLLSISMTAPRAIGALLFVVIGGSLETWGNIYFIANGLTVLVGFALFCPRFRISCNVRLLVGRFRDAMLFAFSTLTFDSQTEVDKLVLIAIAGERAAGIYAISVRIMELAIIPIRTFFVLYSRKLIRERRIDEIVSRNLLIEACLFTVSLAGYGAFLVALSLKPDLLGGNIESARQLFAMALLVPAFRSLMELHSELYFAYGRLGMQAVVTLALVVLKAAMIALLISMTANPAVWGFWLNWIFACLYALSAVAVYGAISSPLRLAADPRRG